MTIHQCDTCNKIFSRREHLTRHLAKKKACKPDHDKKHICEKCNKTFSFDSGLSRHRKTCTGSQQTLPAVIEELTRQLKHAKDQVSVYQQEARDLVEPEIEDKFILRSCGVGAAGDVFKPAVYFGKPGPRLVPLVEVSGGQIVKFGQSHDVPERVSRDHKPNFGGFELLDCVQTIDPVLIEKKLKSLLDLEGKRIKCKAENKVCRDTEVFFVNSQDEYDKVVLLCKSLAEEHEEDVIGVKRAVISAKSVQKEQEIISLQSQLEELRRKLH